MPILSAQNILLRLGGSAPLLDNVSFDIEAGDRICLVGRNGEGKSTLLKVLTGEMEYNSGDVVKRTGLRVSRMIQEIPAHIDGTVRDIVMGKALLLATLLGSCKFAMRVLLLKSLQDAALKRAIFLQK